MKSCGRKWPEVNLLDLYIKGDHQKWNKMLTNCLMTNNVNKLMQLLYGIQVGMDSVAKRKLNSDKMNLFFIRLQRSLESTAKKIYRRYYPCPQDIGFRSPKHLLVKRKRDEAFERFLRDSSF